MIPMFLSTSKIVGDVTPLIGVISIFKDAINQPRRPLVNIQHTVHHPPPRAAFFVGKAYNAGCYRGDRRYTAAATGRVVASSRKDR